jgi:hypothetical protein
MNKPTWNSIGKQIQELNDLLNQLDKRVSSVESTGSDTNRMVLDLLEMTQFLVSQVHIEEAETEAEAPRILYLLPPDHDQGQN